jgi:hypothetical protein
LISDRATCSVERVVHRPSRSLAPAALAAGAVILWCAGARAQEGCGKDTDCKFDRVCQAGMCVDTRPPPPEGPPAPLRAERPAWRGQRFGIYYLASLPVAGDIQPPKVAHSIGVESFSRVFDELRFRFALGYVNQPTATSTQNGIHSEVIGLSYTITALDKDGIQIGIEPIVRLFDIETYFPNGTNGMQVDLSSGWAIGGVFGFGDRHGYVSFEPIGMDLRWLQAGDGIPTVTALGASWRLRLAVGFAY